MKNFFIFFVLAIFVFGAVFGMSALNANASIPIPTLWITSSCNSGSPSIKLHWITTLAGATTIDIYRLPVQFPLGNIPDRPANAYRSNIPIVQNNGDYVDSTDTSNTNGGGLKLGWTYYYWIRAYSASDSGSYSAVNWAVIPAACNPVAAPTGLAIINTTCSGASLRWDAPTGAAAEYKVFNATTNNSANASQVIGNISYSNICNASGCSRKAITFASVASGAQYFWVKAYDDYNADSPYSQVVSTTVPVSCSNPLSCSINGIADGTTVNTNQAINFSGAGSGGSFPYTYSWNFGDGSTGSGSSVSHSYSSTGAKQVTLTISDNVLTSTSCTKSFTVAAGGGGSQCLTGNATANPASVLINGKTILSAPSGWLGGLFSSSNVNTLSISGTTGTGVSAGTANVSGTGWTDSNGKTGCSLSSVPVTVSIPSGTQCPQGYYVSATSGSIATNGGLTTFSAPSSQWSGGSFVSSNSSILSISGSTGTGGLVAGTAYVSGTGWTAPNGAEGCSLSPTSVTVNGATSGGGPIPAPDVWIYPTCCAGPKVTLQWVSTLANAITVNIYRAVPSIYTGTAPAFSESYLLSNGQNIPIGAGKFVDTNIQLGKTYTYWVKAINNSNQQLSSAVFATIPASCFAPAVPARSDFSVTSQTSFGMGLRWKVSDNTTSATSGEGDIFTKFYQTPTNNSETVSETSSKVNSLINCGTMVYPENPSASGRYCTIFIPGLAGATKYIWAKHVDANTEADSCFADPIVETLPLQSANLTCQIMPQSQQGNVAEDIHFISGAAGGAAPYSYSWNFGDGTTSNPSGQAEGTHMYTSAGIRTIRSTVTDVSDSTISCTATVQIVSGTGGDVSQVDTSQPQTTNHTFTQSLRVGSSGNEVIQLQKLLNISQNSGLTTDGKFGQKTKKAVQKFQQANGLKNDGKVGPLTREKLNSAENNY